MLLLGSRIFGNFQDLIEVFLGVVPQSDIDRILSLLTHAIVPCEAFAVLHKLVVGTYHFRVTSCFVAANRPIDLIIGVLLLRSLSRPVSPLDTLQVLELSLQKLQSIRLAIVSDVDDLPSGGRSILAFLLESFLKIDLELTPLDAFWYQTVVFSHFICLILLDDHILIFCIVLLRIYNR
jgi:hypothetical protein